MDCAEYSREGRSNEAWVIPQIYSPRIYSGLTLHSFVSRANPKDSNRHVILGVVSYKPREFANQMNLNLSNGWGIVRTIVDMCLHMPEGKYVLVKDPNKPVLRLYEVPPNTFEEEPEEPKIAEEE